MKKWLEDMLPVMAVEHDCIVAKCGSITVVYEVQLPEVFSLSGEDYEAIHQGWIKAIKTLPKNSVFTKQDWFLQKKYEAGFDENKEPDYLNIRRERFFHERSYLGHRCFILLTKKAAQRRNSTSLSSLLTGSIVPRQTIDPSLFDEFIETTGQFQQIIQDAGYIQLRRLSNNDLLSSEKSIGYIEQYCFLSQSGHASVVKDIELKEKICVGNNHCQLFTLADVSDLPSLTGSRINFDKYSTDRIKFSIGFPAAVGLLLPCNHLYSQYIFIGDSAQTMKKLESKKLRLQSLAGYSRENAISLDAVNEFLNEAIEHQRTPIKAHFNLLVWSDNEDELKEIKNSVASSLAQIEAVAKEEKAGAGQIFWSGIPGNAADFPLNDTFDTFIEQACCFLISESNARSSSSSFGMKMVDRLSGKPVWVDFSDAPMGKYTTNRNKIIVGASGSGKSLLMCAMHKAYYDSGAHCVVVDVGHSYQGLCSLVNGYYFYYDEKNPICFNPFFIGDGDSLDNEKKESLKSLLLSLWKKEDELIKRSEYVALSNAIHLYYHEVEKTSAFPCFNHFYEWIGSQYSEILLKENVREKEFDIANFLYVLKPFYKHGEYDYLLNATEKLDIFSQRFVVFELDNIKDSPILFAVVTLLIMDLFISKMRKLPGIRKVITIEEAWKAISRSGMAEFMRYLNKTVRKHFGETNTVTQEIDDILNNPIIKQSIINNADCKIILDMRKFQNKIDQIQEVMGMSDKGVPMVLSLNRANDPRRKYREFYVDLGGQFMNVYGFEPCPEEYWAYTTEQKEKLRVQEHTAKYGSIQKAIAVIVQEEKERNNTTIKTS